MNRFIEWQFKLYNKLTKLTSYAVIFGIAWVFVFIIYSTVWVITNFG